MENKYENKILLEEIARERVNMSKKFYVHLFVYFIGIVFYTLKTYFKVPFDFLPLKYINNFVMYVWTLFVVIQGVQLVFSKTIFGVSWEQKQINKIIEKEKTKTQKWE